MLTRRDSHFFCNFLQFFSDSDLILVTGVTSDVAQQTLEACNWNLEVAINMHMDTQEPEPSVVKPVVQPPPPATQNNLNKPSSSRLAFDLSLVLVVISFSCHQF